MAAPLDLGIARLRFHGHEQTLNAIWQAFNERPRQALTAGELAEITGRPIEDIHARLTQTPEMFLRLPPKPRTNTRYRLALRVEHQAADAVATYVHSVARSELRVRIAFVSAFVGMIVMLFAARMLSR
jgi:hypothetical protein